MTSSSPGNPFQEFSEAWGSIYPLIHWSLDHPIGSLALAFGGLYLFWGLFRGLIYLTENLWLQVLRSPLSLARYVWRRAKSHQSSSPLLEQSRSSMSGDPAYFRLNELIHQLEEGHQRQAQLLELAKTELQQIKAQQR